MLYLTWKLISLGIPMSAGIVPVSWLPYRPAGHACVSVPEKQAVELSFHTYQASPCWGTHHLSTLQHQACQKPSLTTHSLP